MSEKKSELSGVQTPKWVTFKNSKGKKKKKKRTPF